MSVHTKKIRKAKSTHMKYPCIPVWMKEREKDPFDYPLRSRKEIAFEQHLNPPMFTAKFIFNNYFALTDTSALAVNKADNRNNECTLELNINEMHLSPLQKKRLIFLLGQRWKGDNKVKIVSRTHTNFEHNTARAFEILRQLYWEAKRAPLYIWSRMKNSERRRLAKKIFGKGKSVEEMEKLKIIRAEENLKHKEKFDEIYDSGNYTPKYIADKISKLIEKSQIQSGESLKQKEERMMESSKKMEEVLSRENLDKELIKKRILTKKAYDTFFDTQENLENEKIESK